LDPLVEILYWYTRTTTEGLSYKAQYLSLALKSVQLFDLLQMKTKDGWLSFDIVIRSIALLCVLLPLVLQMQALLRIEYDARRITRRPATKNERNSKRIDSGVGWIAPLAVSSVSRS
jgi:hypothetical protein